MIVSSYYKVHRAAQSKVVADLYVLTFGKENLVKRWKITAKKDRSLTVFLTAESLYTWISDGCDSSVLGSREFKNEISIVSLKKGDELFVEWLGSEYVYDDKADMTHTLKFVKLTTSRCGGQTFSPVFIDNINAWLSDDILELDQKKSTVEQAKTRRNLSIVRLDSDDEETMNEQNECMMGIEVVSSELLEAKNE